MAIYVLVHGGGHGGWCYQPLARILRARGHEVYTPTMTGLGERQHLLSPQIGLDMHITDIVKVLEFEDLRNVILAGHSYGGTVIIGVADRAANRIGHLVFLDAPIPKNGKSLADAAGPPMLATRIQGRVVDGVELVLYPTPEVLGAYGVTQPVQLAWMTPKLTPHPWKCFEQKLIFRNELAMRKIPQTHIVCSTRLVSWNCAEIEAASDGRVWEIDTGHDLMITEPEAIAEMLLRVASL